MNNLGLICVTHDPNGDNLEFIRKHSKTIKDLYDDIYIAVSDESDSCVLDELTQSGYHVNVIPKKGAANARREALRLALSGTNQHYHYCDFDRLLTWIDNYENELKETLKEIALTEFLILGRTKRALNTHPIEWIETENITNRIFSLELGQDADVTAGSCGFSRASACLILEYSKAKMTDAEWPMIVKRIGKKEILNKAVEGLEYREDLNKSTKKQSKSEDWFGRLRLCYIISESAIRTGITDFAE